MKRPDSGGRDSAETDGGARNRRPRLEDVAELVGLSPASVSLVLRNAPGPSAGTRERVLEAAARIGYRPDRTASLLARRRSRVLGVTFDIRNSFHAELVENLYVAAEEVGYDLALSTLTRIRDEGQAVETLLDFRAEALVLLGTEIPAARLTSLDRRLPVISVGRRIPAADLDVVRASDDEGLGRAVAHLVELGHRDIAFIDGGKGSIAADRRRGYRTAMRAHRLTDRIRVLPGHHTEEAGARAAELLLAEDALPSAVIACNDRCAVGVLSTLGQAGVSVPDTLSVVGYDDSVLSRLASFDLTTVSQNPEEQARHAVAAAVERLDGGRSVPREIVLTPRLMVRGTTAAPARTRQPAEAYERGLPRPES
ncbi:LacI family DNA-binding transcriptional regulator [Streptomyces sp. NPDC101062]|uniref:LacI family DNA-binding transcriptional regulator n=1 Tax=unclassified Streptomyces TaxID=2593676 RepID=UPI002E7955FD|nr:LacI family DNA-binding transcriptional regulator [Streptomyces sp. JV176]MEE1803144.1 LacI family DNA-binding transcriptional regulator [Streptomyces sp. JV176]